MLHYTASVILGHICRRVCTVDQKFLVFNSPGLESVAPGWEKSKIAYVGAATWSGSLFANELFELHWWDMKRAEIGRLRD